MWIFLGYWDDGATGSGGGVYHTRKKSTNTAVKRAAVLEGKTATWMQMKRLANANGVEKRSNSYRAKMKSVLLMKTFPSESKAILQYQMWFNQFSLNDSENGVRKLVEPH